MHDADNVDVLGNELVVWLPFPPPTEEVGSDCGEDHCDAMDVVRAYIDDDHDEADEPDLGILPQLAAAACKDLWRVHVWSHVLGLEYCVTSLIVAANDVVKVKFMGMAELTIELTDISATARIDAELPSSRALPIPRYAVAFWREFHAATLAAWRGEDGEKRQITLITDLFSSLSKATAAHHAQLGCSERELQRLDARAEAMLFVGGFNILHLNDTVIPVALVQMNDEKTRVFSIPSKFVPVCFSHAHLFPELHASVAELEAMAEAAREADAAEERLVHQSVIEDALELQQLRFRLQKGTLQSETGECPESGQEAQARGGRLRLD